MQLISNDKFKSVEHRVRASRPGRPGREFQSPASSTPTFTHQQDAMGLSRNCYFLKMPFPNKEMSQCRNM
ncbi:hypothetical protein AXF42_Ash007129 [Apostasia shenzhenica]|uniref:Uncharacterized protein n=1 Tax=Apostasia shenzhenica TaxID=1088818 RepID=A0A2I0BF57_9ASPA|nr:hypothetical protein AXF42_Ash007129 [Apostasia shenzhenica]